MRIGLMVVCVLAACGEDDGSTRDTGDAAADGTGGDTTVATDSATTSDTASDTGADTSVGDTGDTSVGDTGGDTGSEDTGQPADTTTDAADTGAPADADGDTSDTTPTDAAADAEVGPSCLALGHAVGDRYPAGDHCNFCECRDGGVAACTTRKCDNDVGGCDYDGRPHAYAERFPATDGCNECVCAASGLACTHRCPELPQEGAILLESMSEPCGEDATFTGNAVWGGFPYPDLTVPFTYTTDGPLYPETLPPTTLRLRVVREDEGYVVCRIPSPEQPAIDMEVMIEWITADGQLDEGFHTYLRRNDFGFVDGWFVAMGANELDGAFDPNCLDPNGFAFGATYLIDRSVSGDVGKICETDILLTVGTFEHTPEL